MATLIGTASFVNIDEYKVKPGAVSRPAGALTVSKKRHNISPHVHMGKPGNNL
jgi:hypothetical protein